MIDLGELDLIDPGNSLSASDRPSWVLVRAGRRVLGQVQLPPLSATAALRATADLRATWCSAVTDRGAVSRKPEGDPGDITVVVCTRDRAGLLEGCLRSLLSLDPAPGAVVVVDNASRDDATAKLCADLGVDRVVEPTPGLSFARDRGVAATGTPIVAFVDDDTRVDRHYAGALASAFSVDGVDAVTGLVLAAELRTTAQIDFERLGGMSKGFERQVFHRDIAPMGFEPFRIGVGANMAMRVGVLNALGGFDPRLGAGSPTRGGEDLDILARLHASGATIAYDPDVLVRHIHRRSRHELVRQMYNQGVAFSGFIAKAALEHPASVRLVHQYRRRWHLRHHLRPFIGALRHGRLFALQLLLAEALGARRGAGALSAGAVGRHLSVPSVTPAFTHVLAPGARAPIQPPPPAAVEVVDG